MSKDGGSKLPEVVRKYEQELLAEWIKQQLTAVTLRRDLMNDAELRKQSRQFLDMFLEAVQKGDPDGSITAPAWEPVRELLSGISSSRAKQGCFPRGNCYLCVLSQAASV